ncbi:hypothetical protein FA95DRAFT_1491193 [Auriscalpium vulgare]|uniref:Uncharacterized protein n=1 Tax=Auriscalpium vulgare TaxID=40419 RepID=A0ACB8RVW1_9AGAM|nr:hypothetical protein FA95DRAFT_1491193 [Auriscalpium vulgare]
MRSTLPRLVRLVPRSTVAQPGLPRPKVYDELPRDLKQQPPLVEVLLKRKEVTGADFPPNIRIEPIVSKKTFEGVSGSVVGSLRAVLREQ